MTGFRDWARAVFGPEQGDQVADDYAAALGRTLDATVFHGTQPIQENHMPLNLQPPPPDALGHTFQEFRGIDPGPHAKCVHCGMTAEQFLDSQMTAPCPPPGSDGPALVEDEDGAPYPGALQDAAQSLPDLEGLNEAERLGLIVGATLGNALYERDQARRIAVTLEQENAALRKVLDETLAAWPTTTWAQDAALKDRAVQAYQSIGALESPETPDSPQDGR